MVNRYDELERQVGISSYVSSHEGFAAVIKARYSDFIVHEVDLNGNVARLESMETPTQIIDSAKTEPSMSDKKRKSDDSVDDVANNQPVPASLEDHEADSSKQDLTNLIGESLAQEVLTFLQQHDEGVIDPLNNTVEKFFILPEISDKETRRSVHMLIKSPAFSSMALADNADGRIRIWRKRFAADMPKDTFSGGRDGDRAKNNSKNNSNGGGRSRDGVKRAPWPKDRPNFLRFVLYKENIDTTTATKDVVKMAHLNPKSGINYAGMKDKRGVTTQFCSVYRMEKEQLLAVNKDFTDSSGGGNTTTQGGSNIIRLGNFHYSNDEVRLGALTGNRFDVVLRNIDVGEDDSPSSRKQQIQKTLEAAGNSLKAHGFINYFGCQRFGKYYDTHLVGIAVLKGDFEKAVKIIMDEKPDEFPRIAEARSQWARRFESIDITAEDEKSAREAEMKCARAIQNVLGRFMNCEKSIVSSLARKPRDYHAAFCSIAKNMRSMFLHAYQSYLWNMVASHRMELGDNTEVRVGDLVQIETGMDCASGGTSGLKGKSVKLIREEDVLNSRYKITDVVLPLAGSKIMYPGGTSGRFFDELLKKDGISRSDFAKIGDVVDREIALGGDYRKLICKPDDVSFEIKVYSDPLQPLLQTDLMKVKNIDVAAITLSSSSKDQEMHTQNQALQEDNQQEDIIFGMNVGFSLPSSSYATIALRELTKRPTSSEYQSKLEVGGGRCERNLGLTS